MTRRIQREVIARAHDWNDTAATWLAHRDDVQVERLMSGVADSQRWWYRFTLPTGTEIDWDPLDGWDGPSSAMDAMVEWLSQALEER